MSDTGEQSQGTDVDWKAETPRVPINEALQALHRHAWTHWMVGHNEEAGEILSVIEAVVRVNMLANLLEEQHPGSTVAGVIAEAIRSSLKGEIALEEIKP